MKKQPAKEKSSAKVVPAKPLPNTAQLCDLTNLTEMRLRQLAKEGWFPSPKRGVWDLAKVIRGTFSYYQNREGTKKFQELRHEKLEQAIKSGKLADEMAELDAAERRGDLMRTAEVDVAIRDCFLPVRQRLLSLPNEVAARANPSDPSFAREALTNWVDQALTLIRDGLPKK